MRIGKQVSTDRLPQAAIESYNINVLVAPNYELMRKFVGLDKVLRVQKHVVIVRNSFVPSKISVDRLTESALKESDRLDDAKVLVVSVGQ